MQEEKLNNWLQNLEDVPALQHATLKNKDAAWEKLHGRLHEKNHRKTYGWFWLAAASVLFLMMLSLYEFRSSNNINQSANTAINTKKIINNNSQIVMPVEAIASTKTVHQSLQKDVVATHHLQKIITDTTTTTQLAINKTDVIKPVAINVLSTADTLMTASNQSIQTQKKLKVVHVNELGEPIEFPAEAARTADLHLFQLKLAQQEIYNASSTAINNSSLSFKPKNSPN